MTIEKSPRRRAKNAGTQNITPPTDSHGWQITGASISFVELIRDTNPSDSATKFPLSAIFYSFFSASKSTTQGSTALFHYGDSGEFITLPASDLEKGPIIFTPRKFNGHPIKWGGCDPASALKEANNELAIANSYFTENPQDYLKMRTSPLDLSTMFMFGASSGMAWTRYAAIYRGGKSRWNDPSTKAVGSSKLSIRFGGDQPIAFA